MSAAPIVTEDAVAEQAAMWVARLSSRDATDGDRREFDAWVAASPEHAAAYDEMAALWADLAKVPRSVGGSRGRRLGAVATVAALLCIGFYGAERMGYLDRLQADYYTPVGHIETVVLEDGSRVTLNTDTAIKVVLGERERRIVMLRGEAFFDVSPDASRPFVVEGDHSSAVALGTHYTVRVGNADDVAVEEGHVSVSTADRQVMLDAGGVAHVARDGDLASGVADVAAMTSWREGKLVFSGRPLSEVLDELGRYRNGRIIVVGEALAQIRVSGVFDTRDVGQSLAALEASMPIVVRSYAGGLVTLVRPR
ncbi:FecR family protein [Rhizobium sp. S152]|uniref:FecR family protein n=1 Tax=Rhizobium sp. S152 TaxID=3055038 RepID=UPI0025A9D222|nr:FecR family protein [Rhizobium sp. S152]MDM9629629.1 FecR family protein [Rhizobium sp. S152]